MRKRASHLKPAEPAPLLMDGHVRGKVVATTKHGALVEYPGNPHGPLRAERTTSVAPTAGAEVLLVFEGRASDRPVIVGILQAEAMPETAERLEARVDGKRVVVEAQDEVVLQCGKASITLRRNGRVVIRGTFVETRAEGVNRIRGGTVQIN